jgi:hypothetical protein
MASDDTSISHSSEHPTPPRHLPQPAEPRVLLERFRGERVGLAAPLHGIRERIPWLLEYAEINPAVLTEEEGLAARIRHRPDLGGKP